MNRVVVVASLAALLSSVTLAAQSPASGQGQSLVQSPQHEGQRTLKSGVYVIPMSLGCPIYMHAQQRGNQELLNAHKGKSVGVAQRLRLTVANMINPAAITGVRVVVHGTSTNVHLVPTDTIMDGFSDAAKAFDLPFSLGQNENASANLLLRGFTSVQSVSLESVTYADGSSWSPPSGRSCRTALDSLVLVSGR
jgi:hypothetical protein